MPLKWGEEAGQGVMGNRARGVGCPSPHASCLAQPPRLLLLQAASELRVCPQCFPGPRGSPKHLPEPAEGAPCPGCQSSPQEAAPAQETNSD